MDVAVVEAPNIYDRFFDRRTVEDVSRYMGFDPRATAWWTCPPSRSRTPIRRGLAQGTVGNTWKEADFRISFGKMRSHPVEMAHLCVGNVEWIGARCDDFLFPAPGPA